MNLVFKFSSEEKVRRCKSEHIEVTYKLQGEKETLVSYLAHEREDGWWMCELYQFTSAERTVDLQILINGFYVFYKVIQVEGIEFRPLEEVEHKDEIERQPISYSDANWEENLPTDYEDIMKWPTEIMQWTTKKEAFSILRKGFLINDGIKEPYSILRPRSINYDKTTRIWFFLDKNGKKCHLLSASVGFDWFDWADMLSLPESRFGKALQSNFGMLGINTEIKFHLLSCETTYARYLVYKLPEDQSDFEAPVKVDDRRSNHSWYIYLVSPQTPIIRLNADQNTHNLVNVPKMKGHPQQRNDGWMEVQIGESQTAATTGEISMNLKLTTCGRMLKGLMIEGVECRPI